MDPLAVGDKAGQLISSNGLYGIISVLCGVIVVLCGVIAFQYRSGTQKDKTLFEMNGRVSDMLNSSKSALNELSKTIADMGASSNSRFDTVKSMSDQLVKFVYILGGIADDIKKIDGELLRELLSRGRQ